MNCASCGSPLVLREVEGLVNWGCSWCLPVAREALKEASQPNVPPLGQLLLGGLAVAAISIGLVLAAEKIEDTYNWLREELA